MLKSRRVPSLLHYGLPPCSLVSAIAANYYKIHAIAYWLIVVDAAVAPAVADAVAAAGRVDVPVVRAAAAAAAAAAAVVCVVVAAVVVVVVVFVVFVVLVVVVVEIVVVVVVVVVVTR